jgi:hypothetical protein
MSAEDTDLETTTPDDAVSALLPAGVSPAALMEMAEDPENASGYARMLWYEQNVVMRQMSPTLTPAQRLEWIKSLQKVGRLESAPITQVNSLDSLPMIQIVFPNRVEKNVTIEAQPARELPEED